MKTDDQVLAIKTNMEKTENSNANEGANSSHMAKSKQNVGAIRGKPKSGRFWKSQKEKFSTINKTKGLRQNFDKKTALRIELKRTKDLSKQMLDEAKLKQEQRKERRRENIKKAEENKRKSEIVQVITNTSKLKRMRKKQLRFIEKRDTNKQVETSK